MRDNLKDIFVLDEIVIEKDFGVAWQNNQKWREHINKAFSMAYMSLESCEGLLERGQMLECLNYCSQHL